MSENSGTLHDADWSNSMGNSCASSDWTGGAGITAKGSSSEDWNQIAEGETNIWKFWIYFRERPEDLYNDWCTYDSDWKPLPHNFNFHVYTHHDEDPSELWFPAWEPDNHDDDGSNNDEISLVLDILDGIGGPLTSIGTAVVDYIIDGDNSITVDETDYSTDLTFDCPVKGGYADLPREKSDETAAAEVSVRVQNEYADGYHSVYGIPKYTFRYTYSDPNQCSDCYAYTNRYKTITPETKPWGTFEAIQ